MATITASSSGPSAHDITMDLRPELADPEFRGKEPEYFEESGPSTLVIAAGATGSSGALTITALDSDVVERNRRIAVFGDTHHEIHGKGCAGSGGAPDHLDFEVGYGLRVRSAYCAPTAPSRPTVRGEAPTGSGADGSRPEDAAGSGSGAAEVAHRSGGARYAAARLVPLVAVRPPDRADPAPPG